MLLKYLLLVILCLLSLSSLVFISPKIVPSIDHADITFGCFAVSLSSSKLTEVKSFAFGINCRLITMVVKYGRRFLCVVSLKKKTTVERLIEIQFVLFNNTSTKLNSTMYTH